MVTGAQPARNLLNSCSSALALSDMEDKQKRDGDNMQMYDDEDVEMPQFEESEMQELEQAAEANELYERKMVPDEWLTQSQQIYNHMTEHGGAGVAAEFTSSLAKSYESISQMIGNEENF